MHRISSENSGVAIDAPQYRPNLAENADPSFPELIKENRRLRLLAEVADTVTRRLSLDHQLPHLIDLITKALDADRATLFLYDKNTDELFSRILRGEGVGEIRIPAKVGIAGAVFTARIPEIIPDAYRDPRFNREIDRQTGYRTRNIVCVPIWDHDEQVIGVTQVLNKRSGDFDAADLELAEALTRQAASALEQALLVERLQAAERALKRTNRALRTLSNGNQALNRAVSEPELLNEMCRIIVDDGGYRLAWIGVQQRADSKVVTPVASSGAGTTHRKTWTRIDDPHGCGICARAIQTGQTQISQNLLQDPTMAPWHAEAQQYGLGSAVAFPLNDGNAVLAVLMIYASEADAFRADELNLLEELAVDCAYGVRAIRARTARDAALQRWHASLEETVDVIAGTIELRDPYTAGHQQRVGKLAVAIARDLKLNNDQIQGLYLAGIIHDLGKIKVPAEILNRPGQLSNLEFELIKMHAQAGYDIVKVVDFPWPIAQMVLQHHERLDGSGYPRGLRGPEMLMEAKILAVADVVEAMTSHRPYRVAIGLAAALQEIEANKGSLYDPAVVDACIGLFREKGFKFDYAT